MASDHLCDTLARLDSVWALYNQKSLTDAILTEVLFNESNEGIFGFNDVKIEWDGTGLGYTGNIDYMIGFSRIDPMDSCLLVIQAKEDWPDEGIPLVVAAAGCLLKRRVAFGKETPVFAVLTTGTAFRFFAIDIDGVVYVFEKEVLKLGNDGTYRSSTSLAEILRWFYWITTAIKSVSSGAAILENLTTESLAKVRECFGPKFLFANRKVRI